MWKYHCSLVLLITIAAPGASAAPPVQGPPPQAKAEFKTAVGESVGNAT
jgi:hypothetical protein